jgi:hypothetical protein
LLPEGGTVVVEEKPDTAVVFGVCDCPDGPPTVCEHAATSNDTATSAAIRIQPG